MPILTQQARAALEGGHLAHLVTLNEDGGPHVTIVWVGLDGDEIVSGHLDLRKKLRNVEAASGVIAPSRTCRWNTHASSAMHSEDE